MVCDRLHLCSVSTNDPRVPIHVFVIGHRRIVRARYCKQWRRRRETWRRDEDEVNLEEIQDTHADREEFGPEVMMALVR
jgi:hypothetical protein